LFDYRNVVDIFAACILAVFIAFFAICALVGIVNKTVDLCSRLARQHKAKAKGHARWEGPNPLINELSQGNGTWPLDKGRRSRLGHQLTLMWQCRQRK